MPMAQTGRMLVWISRALAPRAIQGDEIMAWVDEETTPEKAVMELYDYLQHWVECREKIFLAREEDLIRREKRLDVLQAEPT